MAADSDDDVLAGPKHYIELAELQGREGAAARADIDGILSEMASVRARIQRLEHDFDHLAELVRQLKKEHP